MLRLLETFDTASCSTRTSSGTNHCEPSCDHDTLVTSGNVANVAHACLTYVSALEFQPRLPGSHEDALRARVRVAAFVDLAVSTAKAAVAQFESGVDNTEAVGDLAPRSDC